MLKEESEADKLLRKVLSFHVDRLDFTKILSKKDLDSYSDLMVEIYNYIHGEPVVEERKDIYGNELG